MSESSPQTLYQHEAHPHTPRNVNEQHAAEQTGFNDRLAIRLTRMTSSMWCTYLFAGIGIGSIVGYLTNNILLGLVCGATSSYFLQLVFLPVLQKGSALLNRHAELQADETHANTARLLHEIDQLRRHLDAQDAELLAYHHFLVGLTGTAPTIGALSVSAGADGPLPPFPRDAKGRFVKRTSDPLPAVE